ncbi:hypothetical protein TNCV_1104991 [Trichonephila clavipes]|nr:hypothetical protein TNCV_1104991 [Trichonephila clavipes]
MQNGVRFVFISRAQHTKRLHPTTHPPPHHHLSSGAETDEMQRALKDNRPDAREREREKPKLHLRLHDALPAKETLHAYKK